MKRYYFDDFEGTIEENEHGHYVKYDDMLLFIANNAEDAPTLELRALRELVSRRDDRIAELEAELKKTKDRGNVYISEDLLNFTNSDSTLRVTIGSLSKNAADTDPVVSKAVAKEPVTDKKGFAVSKGQVFISKATIHNIPSTGWVAKVLDDVNKHLAGVDWSALGGISAAKADDTLRADIEALKESLESNYSLHDEQRALNKHQNQRINDLEDAIQSAFEPKSKGRLDVTTQLEAAILRGFRKGLLKELEPGGILHRY